MYNIVPSGNSTSCEPPAAAGRLGRSCAARVSIALPARRRRREEAADTRAKKNSAR